MLVWMILLVGIAVGGLGLAVYLGMAGRERRQILGRAAIGTAQRGETVVLSPDEALGGATQLIASLAPDSWRENDELNNRLIQAGWDSPTAPLTYITARIVLLVSIPLVTLPLIMGLDSVLMLLLLAWALAAGYVMPIWYLKRAVYRRQETIRRSIPDTLDLLVVCVEAGVSLDSAILRVARDLRNTHPEISKELMVVTRKTNAGVPRAQALRGLFDRTGVEEVRSLVSTMIQSEKWGTSIGRVLIVYAETLRRKRRQAVEKKAATIPLKMMFPLVMLILPALFIIIMGPAVMLIGQMMRVQ